MKAFIRNIMIAVALLCAVSCLEKLPQDGIPADKAITTVREADQAAIGIYAAFKSGSLYSGYLTLLPDIQADLAYAVNGYSNTYGDIWRWNILATDSQVTSVYGSLYEVIARCNFLLDAIPAVEASETDDDLLDRLYEIAGEAYFARALAYSELVKLWCKPYEGEAEAKNVPGVVINEHYGSTGTVKRSSLADSYAFILSDLDKAAERLAPKDDDKDEVYYDTEYFSIYAVWALRSRIALYMKDWDAAIEYSTKIIDSDKFFLSDCNDMYDNTYSYYDYMWQYDHSTESIWKVAFTTTSYGGSLGRIFFNFDYRSFKPDYVPATWVLNLYDSNDLRYGSFFESVTTGYSHGLTWPLLVKYFGNQEFLMNNILHVNMPKVFRLSEQYLIRSEAYVQKGDIARAGADITTLRKARYSSYSGTLMNESNAMDIIENERVKELYMEGFRLMDLKRWHKGFTRTPQEQSLSNGSSLSVQADDPLFTWPIPQHEIMSPSSDIEPNESNK